MKVCPVCKTAKNITRSYYTEENGKIYKVLVYSCRNPECINYGDKEEVKQEIKILKGE
jgi:hypothetical protein